VSFCQRYILIEHLTFLKIPSFSQSYKVSSTRQLKKNQGPHYRFRRKPPRNRYTLFSLYFFKFFIFISCLMSSINVFCLPFNPWMMTPGAGWIQPLSDSAESAFFGGNRKTMFLKEFFRVDALLIHSHFYQLIACLTTLTAILQQTELVSYAYGLSNSLPPVTPWGISTKPPLVRKSL